MDPKKINPQNAFDLVTRRQGKDVPDKKEKKDIEEGFGERSNPPTEPLALWKRCVHVVFLTVITAVVVVGVFSFYWFISNHSEPEIVEKAPAEPVPAIINEAEAKKMIEGNLRAFLQAKSNKERLKYIYMPEDVIASLDDYYSQRQNFEVPLWKIDRMELTTSVQGEIWFVGYRDVKKAQHFASFQRYGDNYLLHWSAMKAYGELPWEEFLTRRPTTPVLMRGYLRQYEGVIPPAIDSNTVGVFIFEDPEKLMTELVVVRKDISGYGTLSRLSSESSHPVTAWLAYDKLQLGTERLTLRMVKLKHLRWQQVSADPRLER